MSTSSLVRATLVCLLVSASCTAFADHHCAGEVGYVATFSVQPDKSAEFETAIANLAAKVNEVEEGVLLYEPYRGAEPGEYFMMERYASEAARKAHGQHPQVQALFGPLGPLMAAPPKIVP
ncbi:MAG: putative quinol monooxygenase, partial [Proteobacteria bacterium]|nr:putative quinol monooxygenase [Pseudomonadota bacterium]